MTPVLHGYEGPCEVPRDHALFSKDVSCRVIRNEDGEDELMIRISENKEIEHHFGPWRWKTTRPVTRLVRFPQAVKELLPSDARVVNVALVTHGVQGRGVYHIFGYTLSILYSRLQHNN